jgi:hypothetical protein
MLGIRDPNFFRPVDPNLKSVPLGQTDKSCGERTVSKGVIKFENEEKFEERKLKERKQEEAERKERPKRGGGGVTVLNHPPPPPTPDAAQWVAI